MPSNQTANYALNQWSRTDRVLMEDFNADNAKIDAALKAETDARTALTAEISKCGNCRVETFTYTGTGSSDGGSKVFTFSGKPAFFLVAGWDSFIYAGGPGGAVCSAFHINGRLAANEMKAVWNGNTVTITGDSRGLTNQAGVRYQVVVFYAEDKQ